MFNMRRRFTAYLCHTRFTRKQSLRGGWHSANLEYIRSMTGSPKILLFRWYLEQYLRMEKVIQSLLCRMTAEELPHTFSRYASGAAPSLPSRCCDLGRVAQYFTHKLTITYFGGGAYRKERETTLNGANKQVGTRSRCYKRLQIKGPKSEPSIYAGNSSQHRHVSMI